MSDKYSEELELIMSMYRSGKITGEQKDELIAALEKRSAKKTTQDCKKIVFRVITEKRNADAAEIVRVLSAVSGVDSVTFDERNSLATVIGEFDVDGIIAAAREGEIRLRVRDIDINYESEQKDAPDHEPQQEPSPENFQAPEQSDEPVRDKAPTDDEYPNANDFDSPDDNEYPTDDDFSDEDEEDNEEEEDEEDDEDEDEADYEQEQDDEVKININDSQSLSEFLKGLGTKISVAFEKGIKAADEAGKKIADFADNTVIKMCDLGKGRVVIKSKPERYSEPYSQMIATVKIVTERAVKVLTDAPEYVKNESRPYLSDDMYSALCALIDSEFTGRYKYVENDAVLKLYVRPKSDNDRA